MCTLICICLLHTRPTIFNGGTCLIRAWYLSHSHMRNDSFKKKRVISHMWMRQVSRTNETCPTVEYGRSRMKYTYTYQCTHIYMSMNTYSCEWMHMTFPTFSHPSALRTPPPLQCCFLALIWSIYVSFDLTFAFFSTHLSSYLSPTNSNSKVLSDRTVLLLSFDPTTSLLT